MTDEQICRKIAESLGWKLISKGSNYDEQLPIWKSPEGNLFAKVPNFFTGPAARDLLVRGMLEEGWAISISMTPDQLINLRMMNCDPNAESFNLYEPYDRIWPLAYLKTIPAAKETK